MGTGTGRTYNLDWSPQQRQLDFLTATGLLPMQWGLPMEQPAARVLGYGGAAGGGKTDALLGLGILAALLFPGCNVAFFRRTYPELEGLGGVIARSLELMSGWCHYSGQKHRWTFPNGSALQFCHCQRESDVYRYQSQQFDILLIDEATHFTWRIVTYLLTRNRATVDGLIPICALGTNPGNVGHLWFRGQFLDPGPPGQTHDVTIDDTTEATTRHFIPARLEDNQALELRDPQYRATLEGQPEKIKRALLYGDWDVFEGQYFDEWRRDLHVIKPARIPENWIKWRAVDWGHAAPWCCLWLARNPDDGETWVYREAYKAGLTDPEQADRIVELNGDDQIRYTLADPSMWTKRSTERQTISTADVYRDAGIRLTPADNHRINGWRRVRQGLNHNGDAPKLRIFDTCTDLIRTLPALIHDDHNVEDVDDDGEDHAPDALRYGLGWKTVKRRPPTRKPKYWG